MKQPDTAALRERLANYTPENELEQDKQALELILSENIIELQFTDNQILIKIQSKTKSF